MKVHPYLNENIEDNFDAIGWSTAQPGDFLMLRHAPSRPHGPIYRIDEMISHATDGRLYATVTRLCCGGELGRANHVDCGTMSFDEPVWQVWRDFVEGP